MLKERTFFTCKAYFENPSPYGKVRPKQASTFPYWTRHKEEEHP
jgi:hypothetical protein